MHAPWSSIKDKGHQVPWINGDFISLFKQSDKAVNTNTNLLVIGGTQTTKKYQYNFNKNAKANYHRDNKLNELNNPKQL